MDYVQIEYHEKIKIENDGKRMEECSTNIHDMYLSSGWAGDTWTWLMGLLGRSGDTLVDIVSDIFTGISNAISAIKTAAEEFVAGIKDGVQYIVINALKAILQSISTIVNSLLDSIMLIVNSFSPNTISKNSNMYSIFGFDLGLTISDLNVELIIGSLKMIITDTFVNSEFQFETLGVGTAMLFSAITQIASNIGIIRMASSIKNSMIVMLGNIAAQIITAMIVSQGDLSPSEKQALSTFYIFNGILSIFNLFYEAFPSSGFTWLLDSGFIIFLLASLFNGILNISTPVDWTLFGINSVLAFTSLLLYNSKIIVRLGNGVGSIFNKQYWGDIFDDPFHTGGKHPYERNRHYLLLAFNFICILMYFALGFYFA